MEQWFSCTALQSLPEICIPSLESFEPTVTELHLKKELYKSKGNNSKTEQDRVIALVHCTLSHCKNMHTKFGVI